MSIDRPLPIIHYEHRTLTDVAARIAAGRALHVERQRRYRIVLDAVQKQALAEPGRHQPVGGRQRQHHQDDDDEAAYEGNHLRPTGKHEISIFTNTQTEESKKKNSIGLYARNIEAYLHSWEVRSEKL